ncbi:MAG: hypothetical protein A2V69_02750 [Candidatus Portnoybacteria bacterium RBG_13_40_8]|uniref:Uncharacterized protein n=1 Tax=Candidatus Portnoybacteria bacterium RBG_13_40_8 TaxID=1801990 RepID=A0A1G2F678_9BACT|nr:MAG: hypothetical protein A2V69_02750 [Candidatus Portnoybacteria bacterium RBG_13_40_8]
MTRLVFCEECGKWAIVKSRKDKPGVDILIVSIRNGRKRKERKNGPVILLRIPENYCIACGGKKVKLLPNHEIPEVMKGCVWKQKGGSY